MAACDGDDIDGSGASSSSSSSSSSSCGSDDDDDDVGDDWESLDYDMGLNSRMMGCFHLRRLELIDIPLARSGGKGGIAVMALRTVLRSCSNLTHLSLGGCFRNWADVGGRSSMSPSSSTAVVAGGLDDVGILLCGNRGLGDLTRSVISLSRHHGNDDGTIARLLPQLMLHDVFHEDFDDGGSDVPGLDELLPDLKVLDVSYCGWVTPGMIVRYLLNVWRRRIVTTGYASGDGINRGRAACDFDGHDGASTTSDVDGVHSINFGGNIQIAKVATSLRHLNIRGCGGLLPDNTPSSPSWTEGWRECGLFDGIDLSVDRHLRMR